MLLNQIVIISVSLLQQMYSPKGRFTPAFFCHMA